VLRKKVWHGESEQDWAEVFLREVVDQGEKALAFCGINHAISEYRQPRLIVRDSSIQFTEDRFGRYLYKACGKRVMTIFLHNYWFSRDKKNFVYPINGYIDALMLGRDSTKWQVGFDVKGTPFGKLAEQSSYYSMGYDDFNLETFCDGYIYLMPLSRYEIVTCIDGFFNEDNIEDARRNAVNPWYRDKPIEEFERSCENGLQEVRNRYDPFY
jgi:hypothetical protein